MFRVLNYIAKSAFTQIFNYGDKGAPCDSVVILIIKKPNSLGQIREIVYHQTLMLYKIRDSRIID